MGEARSAELMKKLATFLLFSFGVFLLKVNVLPSDLLRPPPETPLGGCRRWSPPLPSRGETPRKGDRTTYSTALVFC